VYYGADNATFARNGINLLNIHGYALKISIYFTLFILKKYKA
jgi:hypothetical protein